MFFKKKPFDISGQDVHSTVIKTFKDQGWDYEENAEERIVATVFGNEKSSVGMFIKSEDNFVTFKGVLAFNAGGYDHDAIVCQLNTINEGLIFGSFRLNTETGYLTFNYSLLCPDAVPSTASISTIVGMVIETVDKYDDTLMTIATKTDSIPDVMYG